ncbi:type IV secretion system protein [Sphingobium sp. AN558]|uniref:type IV secretion system protein n=1 Tax=Sphingobium sp. AN558 TaxID=3133442 RepID=UPI0030C1B8F7
MEYCAPFDPTSSYAVTLLLHLSCQTQALAELGYRALGSGAPFGRMLVGLLTIYFAVIGYRCLIGGRIGADVIIFAALRVGFVIMLATQWPAYQPLVFNLATRGPEEVATQILGAAQSGDSSTAAISSRIDAVSASIAEVAKVHDMADSSPDTADGVRDEVATPSGRVLRSGPSSESRKALRSANRIMLASLVGAFASVRIAMAIMLALGPIFVALALFNVGTGLFAGWVRVIVATMLGAVVVPVVTLIELSVLEPETNALTLAFQANSPVDSFAEHLFITTASFAVVGVLVLFAVARAAMALRLPPFPRQAAARTQPTVQTVHHSEWRGHSAASSASNIERISRAQLLTRNIETEIRRESADGEGRRVAGTKGRDGRSVDDGRAEPFVTATRLGQSGRRAVARQSLAQFQRDAAR